MKKNQIFVTILFLVFIKIQGQVSVSKKLISTYSNVDIENIFIQQNSNTLFSGEQLLYKVYCLNPDNSQGISKIAYVELIDENKNSLFKHKIRLNAATGTGDYIIPFTLSSGNYKLIAYTQWMRNAGATTFFQSDVDIINPFIADKIVVTEGDIAKTNSLITNSTSKDIALKLQKTTYTKREKITLNIQALNNESSFGNYTLSIRKVNQFALPEKSTVINYKNQFKNSTIQFSEQNNSYIVYPPEINGELITGIVSKNNKPVANIKVALSIPSKTFVFKTAKTNKFGVFYFDLNNAYAGDNAIIQVSDNKKEKYTIKLTKSATFDYSNLTFHKIKLSPKEFDFIKSKSEHVQIENAYRTVKQDSVYSTKPKVSFYNLDYNYVLDDFKRFPSVKETIVEVVDHTWITTKRGKHTFYVRDYKSTRKEGILPLILIDGILVQDHQVLFDYDIKKIKAIGVITDKFLFENHLYGGVVSVETFNTDYTPITKGAYLKEFKLMKPIDEKKYFEQSYQDKEQFKNIPDFRSQLLWNPNLTINSKESEISFYTSDNSGTYEIKLVGFTYKGEPITVTKTITIKE